MKNTFENFLKERLDLMRYRCRHSVEALDKADQKITKKESDALLLEELEYIYKNYDLVDPENIEMDPHIKAKWQKIIKAPALSFEEMKNCPAFDHLESMSYEHGQNETHEYCKEKGDV